MFAYVLAMLLWIKQTTQAVVIDGGKQQLLLQGEVDVEKPDLEKEASKQDATVKDDTDKHTEEVDADEALTVEISRNLVPTNKWGVESRNVRKGNVALTKDEAANGDNYMEPDTGQHKEVDVIVQVETMDTGQYYDVNNTMLDQKAVMMVQSIDLDRTASRRYYVRLDSRTASEVNGVKTLVVYDLVRETRMGYYRRKDKWVQGMFEDHNHRMVTTMILIVRIDYISVDHKGEKKFYGYKFVEEYKVGHYIAAEPGVKRRYVSMTSASRSPIPKTIVRILIVKTCYLCVFFPIFIRVVISTGIKHSSICKVHK